MITSIYQVLSPSYFYFSSKCSILNIQPELIFSDTKLFYIKGSFFNNKFSQFDNSASRKTKIFIFIACFQLIKGKPTILSPSIKYSHALLNDRDTFWEKCHWGIVLSTHQRVHLHNLDSIAHYALLHYMVHHPSSLQSVTDWNVIMWAHGCLTNNKP